MMDDEQLKHLWHKQSAQSVDFLALKQRWKQLKTQQRWFFAGDICTIATMVMLVIWAWSKLNWASASWLLLIMGAIIPFTIYTMWLRRQAMRHIGDDTQDYLQAITQQLKNNIQLSRLTRQSIPPIVLAMNLFIFIHAWFEALAWASLSRKLLAINAIYLLCYIPLWAWASRREVKSAEELKRLDGDQ